ncbi:MAG: FtsX-like permease family protein [Acidobacteria bacterium]|nr:FtsX-like permease family protein [Acidobacteriota bacterium]
MSWWDRLRNRGRAEDELDRELRDHVERQAADHVRNGIPPREARRRARLEFGGHDQIKELCRDAHGARWIEEIGQDVRKAIRQLGARPAFSTALLIILAVGVGANTAVFSIVRGVLLQPLPYWEPESIVALLIFATATGIVLLMTCATIAGLLLARGMTRAPELGIRGALGAGRVRIIGQLLTECVVISIIGGAAGLALSVGILRVASAVAPPVPGLAEASVDVTVLAFAAGLSIITGLLFGAAPAIAWSRFDLVRIMNDAHAPTGRVGRVGRGQALLVAGQVALALVFLTSAGLLLRSFVAHLTFDTGFDPANLMIAAAWNSTPGVSDSGDVATLMTQTERLSSLPGIEAVTLAAPPPLVGAPPRPIEVAGRQPSRDRLEAGIRQVSPDYAEFLGLRVLDGRFFTERDTAGTRRVAVVSESFARKAFGTESAIGQRLVQPVIRSPRGDVGRDTWEVVGVVADVSSPFLQAHPFFASVSDIYLSLRQPRMESVMRDRMNTGMVVRTTGDPSATVPLVREVLREAFPGRTVTTDMLEAALANGSAQPRFFAISAGVFGVVALALAAVGLYSLLSYTVAQRRREIGMRMALGAAGWDVVWPVLRQGGLLVGAGAVVGLFAAIASTRVLESVLFGVTPADPLTLAAVTALLLGVGLVACWLPARQATRIDPMDVLRGA